MSEPRYDVAVVGGSLAGSAAAAALARGGASVIVLEKARFPRPKICGGFLSPEAEPVLARMGALEEIRAAGPETVTRFALVKPDGRRVEADLPAPVLSLSRERLDALVAAAAERQGARIRFGEAAGFVEGNLRDGFGVRTGDEALRARVLVGAWGRFSPLDGRLTRPHLRQTAALIGFGKQLVGDGSRLAGRAVLHLFPGGYLGLSLVEGGAVNLAALATPDVAREAHQDLDELLARLKTGSAALAADLEGLAPSPGPVLVSEPVRLGPHGAVAGDVLLAGDAAGVIDPYTGTGMALALLSGEAAAGPILRFLAGRLDAGALKREHADGHRALVGRRFAYSRLFRSVFYGGALSRLVGPAAAPLARLAVRLTRGRSTRRPSTGS
ncbi:MAG TPA: FAD-dependent monooxygenase [Thermoanaerobaculia bacterium]|nr:FAD-dependent monooxygenase [Thermoanaerobaculia bacterium]HQR68093.1 FAD-dependent monooxygenase [Thermoanaerobaculia bacterium]